VENGSVMAGQIAGLIDDIKPAADIINDIVNEAKALLNKMAGVY
jgi:enoyl-[acyl-carrier protein] reductase II